MKRTRWIPLIVYAALLVAFLGWISNLFTTSQDTLPYSKVVELFNKEQVRQFVVQDQTITMQLNKPYNGQTTITAPLADPESFRQEMHETFAEQTASGVLESYNFVPDKGFSPYTLILPLLVVGVVLLLIWALLMGRMSSAGNPMNGFSKARTVLGVPGDKKVTFDDVAGEAGVQFLSISGSDFVEMYVGVGAGRVRDLFEQARKIAPAIVFIDEIDAVGRKRGSGLGGGHDEKEQTLNQLLVEMDGFTRSEGVIVLAATNRPDILDPALLRPGRFDRQIHVGRPDVKGREEILKVHAKDKKLDASVNLKTVARSTAGFTGADLSNLLNEAAILAARADRPVLTMEDMNEALMKITAGPAKKSRVQTRKDLKETAVHEAGHAVAMYNLPTHDPVRQITIVPRGQSLGATWYLPKDDSSNLTRNEMYEQIVSLLGGRVAEALFLGDISVGASNDIDRATKLAKDMVARYGMCEKLGTVSYLDGGEVFIGRDYQTTKSYSEKVAGTIDDEVRALIDKAYDHCKQILTDNSDKLHKVVDFLLEKETMTGEQFEAIMQGREVGDASSTSMFDGFEDGKEDPKATEE